MFASNNNSCCGDVDPISYISDQTFFHRTFLNDITINIPNSKQEELLPSPLPFFYFSPSPFDQDHDQVVDLFDHHHHHQEHHENLLLHSQVAAADKGTVSDQTNTTTTAKMVSGSDLMTMTMNHQNHINIEENNATSEFVVKQIPRKRSCKRDRHSKINTARGPRDRRMRLSLEVARKFFGLQDMLGFDKASKTVEWLLIQAKSEIKKLARELNIHRSSCSTNKSTSSTTSECEVVSGTDEVTINGDNQQSCGRRKSASAKEKKQRPQSRKNAFRPLARESRDKARARARERTREKLQKLEVVDEPKQENQLSRFSSWSPFETGEESGTQSQNLNPNSLEALVPGVEEPISSHIAKEHLGTAHEDMVEDDRSFVIMSPSSIFNSLHNNGISQEHQFADFQFFGKSWDVYNNHNLC
ncbi:hypothetical protein FNV43_RR20080 [Rhamnella rubrinervis]|uniref:Uncharacterized protein n=1 Tax=Rhamnella rubrinervis TaxID=2594499 RepID=A0A8K0DTS6_9ROSA|nr:hypothetical protein FNV43_RR20080 [Rhamnella rubrinervis]